MTDVDTAALNRRARAEQQRDRGDALQVNIEARELAIALDVWKGIPDQYVPLSTTLLELAKEAGERC